MAYFRRLPSGKWQATVRGRDGRRHTQTDELKGVVRRWAAEQEALMARGEFRDPRLADIRIGTWHDRVAGASAGGTATKGKRASLWRTHCEREWAAWSMGAVTRMEAQEWVTRLMATPRQRKGRAGNGDPAALSAETVAAAVHLMSSLYTVAMKETPPLVTSNPFAGLDLPELPPRPVEFLERAEAEALYAAAEAIGRQWGTLAELGTEAGLRPGELYGLHGHRVDWLRGRLTVADVMTRDKSLPPACACSPHCVGLRQWPKSKMSHRTIPVPPHILEGMSALMAGRPRASLVFTAPEGGPVTDGNFRTRVWYPAVKAAGIRCFAPRIMRHTAASWLVQDGVPLYDVQALLGHENFATTQRYAHLAPDAHEKVIESWARRKPASVTHELNLGGSK